MKKLFSLFGVALAVLLASGCKAQDQNAAAFQAASKNVVSIKNVVISGDNSLDVKLTALGGYPASADVSTSKKATDVQYSLGYDVNRKPVVAVSIAKDGAVVVVTDPDLLTGYAAKIKALSGEKSASAASSDSSGGGDHSGAAPVSGGVPKGCPIRLGDSKAAVRKKVGTPDDIVDEGTDHEVWHCHPLQAGQVVNEAASSFIASMPFGGGIAHQKVDGATKTRHYAVHFAGGSVSSVEVLSF